MKKPFCHSFNLIKFFSGTGAASTFTPRLMTGMTLIELMVVLALMAILMTVAIPSFTSLIQSNRVASEVNGFIGSLQFARAEAIKQGLPVTVCTSSDGSNCLDSSDWNTGWIVFVDPNNNKTHDSSETVLKVQPKWTSTDTFTANNDIEAITYTRDGFALGLTGTATLTLHTNPENARATRCVVINLVGRQQVQPANGNNCT